MMVDQNLLMSARKQQGFDQGFVPTAMAIGNTILINKGPNQSLQPGNLTMAEASTIAHESIYTIQTDALNGISNFQSAYEKAGKNVGSYKKNPFEKAAHEFGGNPNNDLTIDTQHFLNNGVWWK